MPTPSQPGADGVEVQVVVGPAVAVDVPVLGALSLDIGTGIPGPQGDQGPVGPQGPPGATTTTFEYAYSTQAVAPPNSGQIRTNGPTAAASSTVWLHRLDKGGLDRKPILMQSATGSELYLQDDNDSTAYAWYVLASDPVDQGDYVTFALTFDRGGGTPLVGNRSVLVGLLYIGEPGPPGPPGPPTFPYVQPDPPTGVPDGTLWLDTDDTVPTVPGPPGPAGPASTVPGPQGPPGAASTVPGPTGPAGADSTVPGPQGIPGPPGSATKVDAYLTPGTFTWTKPAGAVSVQIIINGSGGGGGSGRRGLAGSVRCGGGGGASGGYSEAVFQASDVPGSVTVIVAPAGAGGAAVTADSTDGNPGVSGGTCYFKNSQPYLLRAGGGQPGAGGTAATGTGGNGGVGLYTGSPGAAASTTGLAGAGAGSSGPGVRATGGGAGGGLTTGNVAGTGGSGGTVNHTGNASGGGAVGVAGQDSSQVTSPWTRGGPGGGGGGSPAQGGAGAWGGGGGGGGASLNGTASGAGGNGGDGYVVVITAFGT